APIPAGTDVVWGQGPWGFSGTPFSGSPFLPGSPMYGGLPFTPGASWGALPPGPVDPFYAQRAFPQAAWPSWQPPLAGPSYQGYQGYQGYPQSFAPIADLQRQALVSQALAAKHSVLEAICRAAGIPV